MILSHVQYQPTRTSHSLYKFPKLIPTVPNCTPTVSQLYPNCTPTVPQLYPNSSVPSHYCCIPIMYSAPLTWDAWLVMYWIAQSSDSMTMDDHLCPLAPPRGRAQGVPRFGSRAPPRHFRASNSRRNVNAVRRAAHAIGQPQWRGHSH